MRDASIPALYGDNNQWRKHSNKIGQRRWGPIGGIIQSRRYNMKGVMVVDVREMRAWIIYEDQIPKIENVKCLGSYSCEAFLVATSYFRTV